ncbi:MAG TPA: 23S rRNA (guanosine(2251)-2'-O)-methyltransferase RlmB [Polyangiaceae bacterium]|nr:23S rRNA (guanosine(2251)-2'-O)-methyltransferase RlmB [Polyangiaceae bacterium]
MSGRIICGVQPVREAIKTHGAKLSRVMVLEAQSAEASPQLDALARYAHDHGARVERVPRSDLDRVAHGIRHQGAIAFASELSVTPLHEVELDAGALVVALDEIQDPQNFGAVIRSAVAMSASAIVWPEHRSAPLSPATFRASAGAIEHATLCRVTSLVPALEGLRERGVAIVGLDMTGPTTIDQVDLTGPVALVVGAEGKGLRKTVKRACDSLARLPMPGPIDSLNASVAVAIALYECVRQRGAR